MKTTRHSWLHVEQVCGHITAFGGRDCCLPMVYSFVYDRWFLCKDSQNASHDTMYTMFERIHILSLIFHFMLIIVNVNWFCKNITNVTQQVWKNKDIRSSRVSSFFNHTRSVGIYKNSFYSHFSYIYILRSSSCLS